MVRKTIGLDTKNVLVLLLLLVTAAGIVYANTPVRTPDGLNKVLVYMAADQYDPNMPPPDGDIVI